MGQKRKAWYIQLQHFPQQAAQTLSQPVQETARNAFIQDLGGRLPHGGREKPDQHQRQVKEQA